jgi:hypothetical protein
VGVHSIPTTKWIVLGKKIHSCQTQAIPVTEWLVITQDMSSTGNIAKIKKEVVVDFQKWVK